MEMAIDMPSPSPVARRSWYGWSTSWCGCPWRRSSPPPAPTTASFKKCGCREGDRRRPLLSRRCPRRQRRCRRRPPVTSLVSCLHGLKRKMEDGARAEELQVQRCQARLDQLAAGSAGDDVEWEDKRLKWILVDYMLRMSNYDTTTKLARLMTLNLMIDSWSPPFHV